jgi:hypothetical protein
MKLRCYKVVFPVAFRAEVLGVLIAVLPVGVFAASTMNSERWFHQEPSIELASPVATVASETGLGQARGETLKHRITGAKLMSLLRNALASLRSSVSSVLHSASDLGDYRLRSITPSSQAIRSRVTRSRFVSFRLSCRPSA